MNKCEVRVDYAVRHITTNHHHHHNHHQQQQQDEEKGSKKRRPKSASATTTNRRKNSLLAATIQDEFVFRKSNMHNSGGEGVTGRFDSKKPKSVGKNSQSNTHAHRDKEAQPAEPHKEWTSQGMGTTFESSRIRPATAPKRRPPVLIMEEDNLPLWQSRGKVDTFDTLLQQDNKVSLHRRGEWPKVPKAPGATENVLGPEKCALRKTIKSSTSRLRFPKTSGPIANLKPYKMEPHHYPPVIHRSEDPVPDVSLRDRSRWNLTTTCFDSEERAKPEGRKNISSEYFHELYSLPPQIDRDYVSVTTSLETIKSSYPRGRFS